MAVLVAIGVAASGERRVLGLELASGNDEGSAWPRFVRSLLERGLAGVRLVGRSGCPDRHPGFRDDCSVAAPSHYGDWLVREIQSTNLPPKSVIRTVTSSIPWRDIVPEG